MLGAGRAAPASVSLLPHLAESVGVLVPVPTQPRQTRLDGVVDGSALGGGRSFALVVGEFPVLLPFAYTQSPRLPSIELLKPCQCLSTRRLAGVRPVVSERRSWRAPMM